MFEKRVAWTFKTWISRFQGVDLPIGDLAEDVARDPSFPELDNFGDIYVHIESSANGDPLILETFALAWGYYLASRDDSWTQSALTSE